MKRFLLLCIMTLLIVGCGHNRYNEFKTWGIGVTVPMGDLGSLSINVGSSQNTIAMVRGGSSFTTEAAEGAGLFSGAGGSAKITTFKSNTQLNEGNLRKVLTSPDTPESVKLMLAKKLAAASTAPDIKASAMQVREATVYSNGFTNELHNQFKSTGVDKALETVDNSVNSVAGIVNGTISNTIGAVNSTVNTTIDTGHKVVRTVVDGTASVSRSWAISTLVSAILGIVGMLAASKKAGKKIKSKLPKRSGLTPPDLGEEGESGDNQSGSEKDPIEKEEDEDDEEEEPLDPKAPWWKKLFRWLVGLVTALTALWKNLPEDTQDSIKNKASKVFKRKKREIR